MKALIALLLGIFVATEAGAIVKKFQLNTLSRSYYEKDSVGKFIPITVNGKRYYQVGNTEVSTLRSFASNKVALVIVDPWADSGSPQITAHNGPITQNKIVPLVQKAVSLGINTIVMTNRFPAVGYDGPIDPTLQQLVNQKKITKLYHEDWTPAKFAAGLQAQGITAVFYAGFQSNKCIIGRPSVGLVGMVNQPLKLYFIPDASAAQEFDDWTSDPGPNHVAATLMISQWLAEIVNLSEFLAIQ